MTVLAVRTRLAIASSGVSPARSVRANRASALTTAARSCLSWVSLAGSVWPSVSLSGARASSIRPNRRPGRVAACSGRVMVAAIMARTAVCERSTPRSRNSHAKAIRSAGSRQPATGLRASAGVGHIPSKASCTSEARSGK